MTDEQTRIVESIKRREQEIEILQLLLKHRLTEKRAECKLTIMYHKACNIVSKAKLLALQTDDDAPITFHIPQAHGDITHVYPWFERVERRASSL